MTTRGSGSELLRQLLFFGDESNVHLRTADECHTYLSYLGSTAEVQQPMSISPTRPTWIHGSYAAYYLWQASTARRVRSESRTVGTMIAALMASCAWRLDQEPRGPLPSAMMCFLTGGVSFLSATQAMGFIGHPLGLWRAPLAGMLFNAGMCWFFMGKCHAWENHMVHLRIDTGIASKPGDRNTSSETLFSDFIPQDIDPSMIPFSGLKSAAELDNELNKRRKEA